MNMNANESANDQPKAQAGSGHEFVIQRIYIKDISFEAPGVPQVFQSEWKPQVELDLNTEWTKLSDDAYEVGVKVTATVKLQDKTAFLVEVLQAGIFTIKGFSKEQLDQMVGSFCPNILFPYAREIISETVNRGSFPPLYLAPINFDAIYQQKLEEQKKKDK